MVVIGEMHRARVSVCVYVCVRAVLHGLSSKSYTVCVRVCVCVCCFNPPWTETFQHAHKSFAMFGAHSYFFKNLCLMFVLYLCCD